MLFHFSPCKLISISVSLNIPKITSYPWIHRIWSFLYSYVFTLVKTRRFTRLLYWSHDNNVVTSLSLKHSKHSVSNLSTIMFASTCVNLSSQAMSIFNPDAVYSCLATMALTLARAPWTQLCFGLCGQIGCRRLACWSKQYVITM